jgi:heptosyltransferase-1
MRVLIVRLGAFGDILHTMPLAADLHAAGHRVSWLCEDRWACVLEGSPVISAIHRLPRKTLRTASWPDRLRALRNVVRELRTERYDAVIDAQGLAKSAILSACSGATERLGHARPRAREGAWLVASRRAPCTAVHVIDQQRALGQLLPGVSSAGPWQFPLPAWEAERAWAADWLAGQGLANCWMLNVGAGWPTKVWPEERMTQFAREAGRPVLLLWGNPAERASAERVAAASGAVMAPDTTIPRLAGLLSHAAVLVSGDTGPLHLARALGTPAIGLFGPVPAERNGPQGDHWLNLQAPGAAWERRDVSKVDMGAITSAAALEAARTVAR